MEPADEHPEHDWTITIAGFGLARKWRQEPAVRAPDTYMTLVDKWGQETTCKPPGTYMRLGATSTTSKPIIEVIENMLQDSADETGKQPRRPLSLWAKVEGMPSFLNDKLLD